MTAIRLCLVLALFLCLAVLPACNSPEPFTGGVEVTTSEEPAETPGAILPVPEVPDTGQATNGDHFAGYTDASGIDQHPTASTGTTWTVIASFSVVIEPCPDGQKTGYVSGGGAEFDFLCVLY
jgi:hypothetical protein